MIPEVFAISVRLCAQLTVVPAMAEAHQTSAFVIDAAPVHEYSPNLVQNEVDALKQELIGVKTTLQSLKELVQNLTGVKGGSGEFRIMLVLCLTAASRLQLQPPLLRFQPTFDLLPSARGPSICQSS